MTVLAKTVLTQYHVLKSIWGIHIVIKATWSVDFKPSFTMEEITPNLHFLCKKYLIKKEIDFLKQGLKIISSKIEQPTLITVENIDYNPCDYQSEGLVPTIVQWAGAALDFVPPEFTVEFKDKKYIFDFDNPIEESGLRILIALQRKFRLRFEPKVYPQTILFKKGLIEEEHDMAVITKDGENFLLDCRIKTLGDISAVVIEKY